jgi:hypothetical protein
MSSEDIPVKTLQRIGRFRKLFQIGIRTKRGEALSKDDVYFLNQLAFTLANDLINGVQLPLVPTRSVLGDKTIEPRLREIITPEIERLGIKEYIENPSSIYFH